MFQHILNFLINNLFPILSQNIYFILTKIFPIAQFGRFMTVKPRNKRNFNWATEDILTTDYTCLWCYCVNERPTGVNIKQLNWTTLMPGNKCNFNFESKFLILLKCLWGYFSTRIQNEDVYLPDETPTVKESLNKWKNIDKIFVILYYSFWLFTFLLWRTFCLFSILFNEFIL